MSVLKNKRQESKFEVFHHLYKLRKELTDLLLRDFGYKPAKAEQRIQRTFGGRSYEELSDTEQVHYDRLKTRNDAFTEWFIVDQRKVVMECLREIQANVFMANSIYPIYEAELIERRLYQDRAIGQCYRLIQELQYAIAPLPVDVYVYLRFSDGIATGIYLF